MTARGVDVNSVRRGIGIVFQAFNLFPHMSVLRNVTLDAAEGAGAPRTRRRRARELLGRFGLADKQDEYPGPALRRPAAARGDRARARDEADLLLLDEVTSALDPELVAEVLEVIRELAEGGMTMLIATHEMAFARDIAEPRLLSGRGVILEEGPPAQICSPHAPREESDRRRFLRRPAADRPLLEPLDDCLVVQPSDEESDEPRPDHPGEHGKTIA